MGGSGRPAGGALTWRRKGAGSRLTWGHPLGPAAQVLGGAGAGRRVCPRGGGASGPEESITGERREGHQVGAVRTAGDPRRARWRALPRARAGPGAVGVVDPGAPGAGRARRRHLTRAGRPDAGRPPDLSPQVWPPDVSPPRAALQGPRGARAGSAGVSRRPQPGPSVLPPGAAGGGANTSPGLLQPR